MIRPSTALALTLTLTSCVAVSPMAVPGPDPVSPPAAPAAPLASSIAATPGTPAPAGAVRVALPIVVSFQGKPLAGRPIRLSDAVGGAQPPAAAIVGEPRTDEHGRCRLTIVRPLGVAALRVSVPTDAGLLETLVGVGHVVARPAGYALAAARPGEVVVDEATTATTRVGDGVLQALRVLKAEPARPVLERLLDRMAVLRPRFATALAADPALAREVVAAAPSADRDPVRTLAARAKVAEDVNMAVAALVVDIAKRARDPESRAVGEPDRLAPIVLLGTPLAARLAPDRAAVMLSNRESGAPEVDAAGSEVAVVVGRDVPPLPDPPAAEPIVPDAPPAGEPQPPAPPLLAETPGPTPAAEAGGSAAPVATATPTATPTAAPTPTPSPTPSPVPTPRPSPGRTTFALPWNAGVVAFDPAGRMWVGRNAGTDVLRFPAGSTDPAAAQGYTVPADVRDIAFDGAGNAWISTWEGRALAKIPADHTGSHAVSLYWFEDKLMQVAVGGNGEVWAQGDATSRIYKIRVDAEPGVRPVTIDVGAAVYWLALDAADNVWLAQRGAGRLLRVPAGASDASAATKIEVGGAPQTVAVDQAGRIWYTDFGGTLYRLPAGATDASGRVSLGSVGGRPTRLTLDPAGNAWVTSMDAFRVTFVPADATDDSRNELWTIPGFPQAVGFDGLVAWVPQALHPQLTRIVR